MHEATSCQTRGGVTFDSHGLTEDAFHRMVLEVDSFHARGEDAGWVLDRSLNLAQSPSTALMLFQRSNHLGYRTRGCVAFGLVDEMEALRALAGQYVG